MPRLLIPVLASLALLLAGCGGDASKEEFQAAVVAARDRVDAGLAQVTKARDFDELLDQLEIAASETRKAATDLDEADAPGNLRDAKRDLVDALRALSEEIVGTVSAFDQPGQNIPIPRGFSFTAWNTVQKALADLRDAGITVQPLGRHGGPASG